MPPAAPLVVPAEIPPPAGPKITARKDEVLNADLDRFYSEYLPRHPELNGSSPSVPADRFSVLNSTDKFILLSMPSHPSRTDSAAGAVHN